MANKLIPEELQALIQQYLTDGVLTDKERTVILKKAEGMGLDRDEIDLYLDAEVQKLDQLLMQLYVSGRVRLAHIAERLSRN